MQARLTGTIVVVLIILAGLGAQYALGQDAEFPILKGHYLGQGAPPMEPKVFAPGVLSHTKYRTYTYVFLPDGNECVFDYYGDSEYKNGAIFSTRLEEDKWTEPAPAGLFAGIDNVFLPRVSPDGKTWFFTSTSLPVPEGVDGKIPLFYIKKTASGWTAPEYITQAIHASATLDGDLYCIMEDREGNYPAFLRPDGAGYGDLEWCEPRNYFGGDMAHLVVAPDGSYMIFDSEKRPRLGECRLHVTFRKADGTWTMPMSLGSLIDLKATMPWISPDGKYIFFRADNDVYWVNAGIVEKIKPKGITAKKK